jgi:hypothetical protein
VICVTATAGSPIPELLAIAIFRRAGAHDEPSRSNRPEPPVAHSGMKKPRHCRGFLAHFKKRKTIRSVLCDHRTAKAVVHTDPQNVVGDA